MKNKENYSKQKHTKQINQNNYEVISSFVKSTVSIGGVNYNVYALSRSDSINSYKHYLDLQQVNKLPRAKDIEIDKIKLL